MMDADEYMRLVRDQTTPLCEELEPWVYETDYIGRVLKHPLVFQVPFTSGALANKQLEMKRKVLAEAHKERKLFQVLMIYERPYRQNAFRELVEDTAIEMTDEEYWELARYLYTDTENLHEWGRYLPEILEHPNRHLFMDDEERTALDAMSDTLTIYRGYSGNKGKLGWSWTLDRKRAWWFARRFSNLHGTPHVACGKVEKRHVIGYLRERNEEEIVVNPSHVRVYRTMKDAKP